MLTGVIFDLVVILIVFITSIASQPLLAGFHTVSEGHVGVYWRAGALMNEITDPGFHFRWPIITNFAEVQVTMQTDSVENIPCGTSGGVLIAFDKVEVVNRLKKDFVHETIKNYTINYDKTWIFDKIHHEINQFCSSHSLQEVYITLFDTLDEHLCNALQKGCNTWAPGIEVIAVRVTKPRIPDSIRKNFELIEAERTKLQIATESQRVSEKEAETKKMQATMEAQLQADVSRIEYTKKVAEMEAKQKMEAIENEMHIAKAKAAADARFYQKSQEALSNEVLLTDKYLQYSAITAMGNISKVYFGEKIPNIFTDGSFSPLGGGTTKAATTCRSSD